MAFLQSRGRFGQGDANFVARVRSPFSGSSKREAFCGDPPFQGDCACFLAPVDHVPHVHRAFGHGASGQ